jgi:protein phosphatase
MPDIPDSWSDEVLPYLHLYPYRLHLPEVYGFCVKSESPVQEELAQEEPLPRALTQKDLTQKNLAQEGWAAGEPELDVSELGGSGSEQPRSEQPELENPMLQEVQEEPAVATIRAILLENAPLDSNGNLCPAIAHAWGQATATRQVYWLWQLLYLWTPLLEQGVASSLLAASNIRVEGWRVRLCQLYRDQEVLPAAETPDLLIPAVELADLANLWLGWVGTAKPAIAPALQAICQQMQAKDADLKQIAAQLNQLLLEQVAQLPLHVQVFGITDAGPQRSHNEDTCYPLTLEGKPVADALAPRVAIVCDGIGGHEGGEVASQIAVQALKPQIQALLTEIAEQPDLNTPELLTQQLEAMVRVVNNLIASQNDIQGREARRRMGTTLVMALQIPQRVATVGAVSTNSHELYLVNVGDSRAYWITQRYCHLLTVDDDVVTREVRMGRSLYREALNRSDAGALTQALGTRDAEFLYPTIQRFILEEDGILLLCSDGLSDNGLVEQSWAEYTEPLFKGKASLESVARAWINLANQKNGHDNTSIVLVFCRVSSPTPDVSLPGTSSKRSGETGWSPASRALAEESGEDQQLPVAAGKRRSRVLLTLVGLIVFLIAGSGIGIAIWSQVDPTGFQQLRQRILPGSPEQNPQ